MVLFIDIIRQIVLACALQSNVLDAILFSVL
jgi:hypothetical protein